MRLNQKYSRSNTRICGSLAFTLVELTITMGIFLMVISATISSHLWGARMSETSNLKLGVNDELRRVSGLLFSDVCSAKVISIGNGGAASFVSNPNYIQQVGNALQIYSTTNTNYFVRYFHDAADNKLKRMTNGPSVCQVIAGSITNHFIFTSESYQGTVLTNNSSPRSIGLTLQCFQPRVWISGSNGGYKYQLKTLMTVRTSN